MSRIPLKKVKKLHIIINPASGKVQPILPIINAVMKETHIDWEILITKKPHDASKFAGKAIKEGVDAVAVYGGDGTVMEAMQAMIGSETPLAILPGGTGNVLANELKISTDLKQACELILKDSEVRPIDLGKFDEQYFVIRVGLGFEAQMIKGAQRDIKNKFGKFAYVLSSAAAFKKIREVQYHLEIDGKNYDASGITCMIANSGSIGFADLKLDTNIRIDDGLLNVIIVRKVNVSLFGHIAATVLRGRREENVALVYHYQGRDIRMSSTPAQTIQCDGEVIKKESVHAKIIPAAVRIIVPVPVEREDIK